jgi:3-methylcrotonyl-CoA carboxylase alpha subunit
MGEAALKAAHAINYTGAGTVEFLLDVDGSFYFMEMNTRLQVEHPVTELITGEDLVAWQLTVASNKPLPKSQDQLSLKGHAIEARVYAEDPENEFLPSTGTLTLLRPPTESDHIRVDTGVIEGDEVSIYYDPMIAKLIVWGTDREQAINLLSKSLEHYAIGGVATNISYLKRIAESDAFNQADLCTQFIKKNEANISTLKSPTSDLSFQCAALAWLLQRSSNKVDTQNVHNPWDKADGFRLNTNNIEILNFIVNGEEKTLNVTQIDQQTWSFKDSGTSTDYITVTGEFNSNQLSGTINNQKIKKVVMIKDAQIDVYSTQGIETTHYVAPDLGINNEDEHAGGVEAPMNGTVVDMLVEAGDKVEKGQVVAIVEAMKMEHAIKAPFSGTIKECFYAKGDLVDGGAALIDLFAEDA